MKTKNVCSLLVFAGLGLARTAFAGYDCPWYVNPTLRLGVKTDLTVGVLPCSVDAAGGIFVLANEANGSANLRILTDDTVMSRDITADDITFSGSNNRYNDGLVTNRFTYSGTGLSTAFGLSDAPLVAVDATGGRLLAANADFSVVRLFNAKRDRWGATAGSANAAVSVAVSGSAEASGLTFSADGSTLWCNTLSGADKGKVSKWTLSGASLSRTAQYDTGLTAASGPMAVTIDGTNSVVVGEWDASAATKGRIVLVRASDGAVTTLVNDPTHLTGGIVSVRMSHTDDFRPRLYALLDTGDVVAYFCRKEKGTWHWTATFTNAELLSRCKSPYAANAAKVTQFAVSADGTLALIGYRPVSGTTANAKSCFAFLHHTATPWTYYAAGASGNPCSTNGACITDGQWVLTLKAGTTGQIGAVNATGAAYDGSYMGEVLDLSAGVATDSSDASKKYNLNMNHNIALGTNAVWRGPRVLLVPSKHTEWVQFTKGWWGEGNYEEVVIGFSECTGWNPWAGLSKYNRRVVVDCPKMGQIKDTALYGNNTIFWGDLSRWEDFNFPAAYTFGLRAAGYCLASGKLTLPKVQTIGQEAFFAAHNMTELSLSENSKVLSSVGYRAFGLVDGKAGHLKRVVIGCASGCTFASQVFYKQPLEEIVFTGAKPTIGGSSGWDRWCDEKEKGLTIVIPRTAEWMNAIAGKYTPLTDAERQAFHLAHPGRYVPFGVLETSALGTWLKQYVAYLDDPGYVTLKIEKDDFFDDEVTVSSNHAPASDGTYLKGSVVTLTAVPGTTGTFHKWYGGPFAGTDATAKNTTFTHTLTENTWLYCRFLHPWTLSADKKTLSNGNFTLNCSVKVASDRTLVGGKWERHGLYADSDTGYGVCDLGGAITLKGENAVWKIVEMKYTGASLCSERGGKGNARALILPSTLTSITDGQSLHATCGGFWYSRSYETIIFDEPNATGGFWSGWYTCGQTRLDHYVWQLPKLTAVASDALFWNVPMRETKLDWWNLASVNNITGKALFGYDWQNSLGRVVGTLRLPSLCATQTIIPGPFSTFDKARTIEGIELGGATKKTTVKTLSEASFANCSSLKRLTLHNDPAMSVGSNPLNNCTALKEIVLTGKPFTSETPLKNLLSTVTAAETKPLKVYVSKYNGWAKRPAWIGAPAGAEKNEAPGEEVLGVYRGGAASPSGKALVLHRESPFDVRGGLILIR